MVVDFHILFQNICTYFDVAGYVTYIHARHQKYVWDFKKFPTQSTAPYNNN